MAGYSEYLNAGIHEVHRALQPAIGMTHTDEHRAPPKKDGTTRQVQSKKSCQRSAVPERKVRRNLAVRAHEHAPVVRRGVNPHRRPDFFAGFNKLAEERAVLLGVRGPTAAGRRISLDVKPNPLVRSTCLKPQFGHNIGFQGPISTRSA